MGSLLSRGDLLLKMFNIRGFTVYISVDPQLSEHLGTEGCSDI